MNNIHKKNFFSHFLLFLACNAVFFIFQIILIVAAHKNLAYFFSVPLTINTDMLLVVCVHIGLYVCLSLIQAFLVPNHPSEKYVIIIYTSTIGALLSANALYFPQSICGKVVNTLIPSMLLYGVLFIALINLIFFAIRAAMIFINGNVWKTITLCLLSLLLFFPINPSTSESRSNKPNIIIIGIDSLSGDWVTEQHMPKLAALVQQSLHFTNSISPLARTHPAWMSILTGLYPFHHGALENLIPEKIVKNGASIAWLLQQSGYQTHFATDEKRFSNITHSHGFQKTWGPEFGINDFFIGLLNDFPLTNLLINHAVAGRLFPYNYINRASFHSYYPQSFDTKLQNILNQHKNETPLFLSVHFTLPHWPYIYAQTTNRLNTNSRDYYVEALTRVDKQVQHLFDYLEKKGLLDNSLLILLSDHGETLMTPGSRPLTEANYRGEKAIFQHYLKNDFLMDLDKSFGHGSDLLSPAQFQTLLAFQARSEGKALHTRGKVHERVALIDIAPTILDFLAIDNPDLRTDGISLLAAILDPAHTLPSRHFFMESGMLPNVSLSLSVLTNAIRDLYIVENKKLLIREEKLPTIKAQKLFGIIEGDWLLALYPTQDKYIAVIYQQSTGLWSDAQDGFFAQSSPLKNMHKKLEIFYKQSFVLAD